MVAKPQVEDAERLARETLQSLPADGDGSAAC